MGTTGFARNSCCGILGLPRSAAPAMGRFFSFCYPRYDDFRPLVRNLGGALPRGTAFGGARISFVNKGVNLSVDGTCTAVISLNIRSGLIPIFFGHVRAVGGPPHGRRRVHRVFLSRNIGTSRFSNACGDFTVGSVIGHFSGTFRSDNLANIPTLVIGGGCLIRANGVRDSRRCCRLIG